MPVRTYPFPDRRRIIPEISARLDAFSVDYARLEYDMTFVAADYGRRRSSIDPALGSKRHQTKASPPAIMAPSIFGVFDGSGSRTAPQAR